MTNPVLSNEVENSQVIIWQYDHAPNLIGLIDGFNKIATDTVTAFWDYFRDSVFNIQTADAFGLNVLGRLMGLPRPTVEFADGSSDSDSVPDVVPITDALFRRLLLGRFFLFGMSPTVPNYNKYLNIIWGNDAPAVVDGFDMSMEFPPPVDNGGSDDSDDSEEEIVSYAEELAMHEQHPDLIYFYPAGIRTNAPSDPSKMVIGFDDQNLENFADAFSWVENKIPTGGIFAGNEKAKYLDGVTEEGENNG